MIEIWTKSRIQCLTKLEKEQWFDVLNNKLEEDRGISLLDPNLKEKQAMIKKEYIKYLESCSSLSDFYKYYIFKSSDKIVSVCRINVRNNQYILEGLETHKDYYRMGHASKLLDFVIKDLKNESIDLLYSEARTWNLASNNLQIKLGFVKYAEDDYNNLYVLDIREMYKDYR
jgi:RimJ/RimL family protein N-acetyltransferase